MISDILSEAKSRMDKSVHALEDELSKQRAGRASPSLLEDITVQYYGNPTPLKQVASVIVESALMLVVKPYEKNQMPAIEKAIMGADLGLNPSAAGDIIRVPLPPLTEERRKELIKVVRADGENAKISVRNVRRDANGQVRDLLKEKAITEDECRKAEDKIQKATDEIVAKIDTILSQKEKDLMAI